MIIHDISGYRNGIAFTVHGPELSEVVSGHMVILHHTSHCAPPRKIAPPASLTTLPKFTWSNFE